MSSPFWSPGKTALGGEGGGGVSQIRDLVRPYMEPSMAHQGGCCNSCIPNYLQPCLLLYPPHTRDIPLSSTTGKIEKQTLPRALKTQASTALTRKQFGKWSLTSISVVAIVSQCQKPSTPPSDNTERCFCVGAQPPFIFIQQWLHPFDSICC